LLQQNFTGYIFFHLKKSLYIFIEPGKAEMDLFTGKLTYGRIYTKTDDGFWATMKQKGWGSLGNYLSQNPSLWLAGLVLLFNIIRLLGFMLFLLDKQHQLFLRLFLAGFILYFAIAAGPIENTRYFLPVSLLVAGFGVMGWGSRMDNSKNRKDLQNEVSS